MGQFSKVLLAVDNEHTVPQRALDKGMNLLILHTLLLYIFDWNNGG